MKIIFAKEYGFCYGVKRAVVMAEEAENLPGATYTLGHLIHNPQVVESLKKKGIGNIDDVNDVPEGSNLVLRSHGVEPYIYEVAKQKKCKLVDATCPNVKKAQKTASDFYSQGKQVLIVGDCDHPEVRSIMGWAVNPIVIQKKDQVDTLDPNLEYGILCQTTLEQERFAEVIDTMKQKGFKYDVKTTICLATKNRQEAVMELAKQVDAVLVVGGFKSANTTHLYELVKKTCPAWHIETAEDLHFDMMKNIKVLGITAGASTPEWLLQEIVKKIDFLYGVED